MAVTLTFDFTTLRTSDVAGIRRRNLVIATTDGAAQYVTGGMAITPNQVKLGEIEAIIPCGLLRNATNAYLVTWDRVNKKLMVFTHDGTVAGQSPLVEAANGTAFASFSIILEIIGF
jgi:hypothetical protein